MMITAVGTVSAGIWAVFTYFHSVTSMKGNSIMSNKGGSGGSAHGGGHGVAIGGKGGKSIGGNHSGSISGGSGGSASVDGDGMSIGGDGGEAITGSFRPALGAPSPLEALATSGKDSMFGSVPVDKYGILMPGRGADSHVAYIQIGGEELPINPLLHLLRIRNSNMIEQVDQSTPTQPQQWWENATQLLPNETEWALAHVSACLKAIGDPNIPTPSPYEN